MDLCRPVLTTNGKLHTASLQNERACSRDYFSTRLLGDKAKLKGADASIIQSAASLYLVLYICVL
jgi:hypothetical protein